MSQTKFIEAGTEPASSSKEYLVFKLDKEEYGIDIQKVQELRGYEGATRIANAPSHVKGVINLRGIIVPVIDMRIRFGMPDPVYDQFTVVVVLNIGWRIIGMVVDSVSDVVNIDQEQIKPVPATGAGGGNHWQGMGLLDDRMVILVDIDALMAASDMDIEECAAA